MQILAVPKSSVQITRGAKSRDKTVAVTGMVETEDKSGELLDRMHKLLAYAVE